MQVWVSTKCLSFESKNRLHDILQQSLCVCEFQSKWSSMITPNTLWSLTLCNGNVPRNRESDRGRNWCFCLVVINIYLVLDGFKTIWFEEHQQLSSSRLFWSVFATESIDLLDVYNVVSSANIVHTTFLLEKCMGRSLMNKQNSTGPSTEPCGTPVLSVPKAETFPLTWTRCCLLSVKDRNSLSVIVLRR